jgi:hypothetical protein
MIARTRTVTLALQASDEASGTWAYYMHIKNARSSYAIHPSACKVNSQKFALCAPDRKPNALRSPPLR